MRRRGSVVLLGLFVMALMAGCNMPAKSGLPSESDGWMPTRPIEYVAAAGPGGGWDTTARATAKVLNEDQIIKQPLTVVNKPGGGGAIGWKYINDKAGIDANHTLFVTSPPIIFIPLNGQSELSHRDFTPIAALTASYGAFIVRADSPYKTLVDLMEGLKSNPSKISIAGTSAPGSMDHMQFLLAAAAAGVDPKTVRYVSFQGAEGMAQLLGGHVTVYSSDVSDALEQYRAGKVRILGVTSPERLGGDAKDIPTVKEQGIDMEFVVWRGVMGPKNMSPAAAKYYEDAFRHLSQNQQWNEARENLGWMDNFMGAEEFGRFLDRQYEEMAAVMKMAGLIK